MKTPFVVLVAEDDALVRNLIDIVLTRAGYSVLLAADGLEALERSARYQGEIHLLLADVTMPGMDGLKLAAQIRGRRPTTRILLISGKMSSEIVRGDATFHFLRKPFVPWQLRAKVEEILTGGHSAGTVERN